MSTLPGFTVFTPRTTIRSAEVNENFDLLKTKGGFWTAYTLAAADFSFAGQTNSATLFNLDPGECVTGYALKHSENFAGGSVTSVLFSVGPSTDNKRFISQHDVSADVTTSSYESSDMYIGSYSATIGVVWVADATGGNLDGLTTGLLEVYIQTAKPKG
jgi:hypothetical protein